MKMILIVEGMSLGRARGNGPVSRDEILIQSIGRDTVADVHMVLVEYSDGEGYYILKDKIDGNKGMDLDKAGLVHFITHSDASMVQS